MGVKGGRGNRVLVEGVRVCLEGAGHLVCMCVCVCVCERERESVCV